MSFLPLLLYHQCGCSISGLLWPDVGSNCSQTGNSEAQLALSRQHPIIPTSLRKKTLRDMGRPSFVIVSDTTPTPHGRTVRLTWPVLETKLPFTPPYCAV